MLQSVHFTPFHPYTDITKLTWRQSHDSASFLTTSNTESTSSAPETDKIVKHFHSGSEGYKVGGQSHIIALTNWFQLIRRTEILHCAAVRHTFYRDCHKSLINWTISPAALQSFAAVENSLVQFIFGGETRQWQRHMNTENVPNFAALSFQKQQSGIQ